MRLIRQFLFASALTLGAVYSIANGDAHEMKIGNLVIEHPWARQSPMAADVAAGYMKIINNGSEDDRLIKATAEISATVQLHEIKMENGVMKMSELKDGLLIPAGQTVELKPGSFHVMFIDLKKPPVEGTAFDGTLTFEEAGTVGVDYDVEAPDAGMN